MTMVESASGRINILSEDIANKIAAGEVVERPASIVKELLENSIDAGATDIGVELEKGGCQSITITDNGSGIQYEDMTLVFERHATSKIKTFDDIYRISSFGFRGEAMPSIASIARVELFSRREGDLAGAKAIVEAGAIQEITPVGVPVGTKVSVTKIFENVPARRKFLKTEATEQGQCLDTITRLALVHPEIRFKVKTNGRDSLLLPRAQNASERIAMVMGADFTDNCLPLDARNDGMFLFGFISRPEFTRSNSKNIFLFVNRRFVRDNIVTHAILSAYRQVIEARRYPAAVVFLDLQFQDVDINVHPAKMEVRFKDSRRVYDIVSAAVAQSLAAAETVRSSFIYRLTGRDKTEEKTLPASFDRSTTFFPDLDGRQNHDQAGALNLLFRRAEERTAGDNVPNKTDGDDLSYLGQFDGTFLIFVRGNELFIIDQHAAHERIIQEKLNQSSGGENVSQALLLPEIVTLSPGKIAVLSEYVDLILEIGLNIEVFGRDAVAVKALPAVLPQNSAREIIEDIADELSSPIPTSNLQERKEKILVKIACKAAIKANSFISSTEAMKLYHDLMEASYNFTCPHGRPTIVTFSSSELKRMFKRK